MRWAFIATFSSAVTLLVAISANAGLGEGLVFYLTFDNVIDQRIVDESGNGLDAKIIENTETVKGKYRDAIRITDEGLNCVNVPSAEKLKVIGKITMMAWIYYPETWKGKLVHWIDKDCHSMNPWTSYGIGSFDMGNGPEIWLYLGLRNEQGNADRQLLVSPHKMDEKKWHHVAGSYDGETMKIYVDGKTIDKKKEKIQLRWEQ